MIVGERNELERVRPQQWLALVIIVFEKLSSRRVVFDSFHWVAALPWATIRLSLERRTLTSASGGLCDGAPPKEERRVL
jgi:hypothetical protein